MEISPSNTIGSDQIAAVNKPEKVEEVREQKTPTERLTDTVSLSPEAKARMEANATTAAS
ncbi:hypothetical protein [Donghicola sp.]|jgi:hypothetical protein|uniref:hypothetical protein n=1 Tax=Donghicola sp. TaxID=1929294 RepID=UPI0025E7920C|nr:hypothetical protein [Donghicola sp.]MCT4576844.1 hypothetical protein [Donghicola sp.]